MLLSNENVDVQNGWRDQQETLLTYLQSGNLHSLRTWIKSAVRITRPDTHHTSVYSSAPTASVPTTDSPALLAILDGVLINYISICGFGAQKQGKDALVVGWNIQDTTRLWLEGWIASQQGWRIDVLAHCSINYALNCSKAVHCWYGAVIIEPPPNSSNSPVGRNKAMIFSHSAFNDSLTNTLYRTTFR